MTDQAVRRVTVRYLWEEQKFELQFNGAGVALRTERYGDQERAVQEIVDFFGEPVQEVEVAP